VVSEKSKDDLSAIKVIFLHIPTCICCGRHLRCVLDRGVWNTNEITPLPWPDDGYLVRRSFRGGFPGKTGAIRGALPKWCMSFWRWATETIVCEAVEPIG